MRKEICKKCFKDHNIQPGWNNADEEFWKNGELDCPRVMTVMIRNDKVHENCKYFLEQMVLNQ